MTMYKGKRRNHRCKFTQIVGALCYTEDIFFMLVSFCAWHKIQVANNKPRIVRAEMQPDRGRRPFFK